MKDVYQNLARHLDNLPAVAYFLHSFAAHKILHRRPSALLPIISKNRRLNIPLHYKYQSITPSCRCYYSIDMQVSSSYNSS
jgi:hypothetical protein